MHFWRRVMSPSGKVSSFLSPTISHKFCREKMGQFRYNTTWVKLPKSYMVMLSPGAMRYWSQSSNRTVGYRDTHYLVTSHLPVSRISFFLGPHSNVHSIQSMVKSVSSQDLSHELLNQRNRGVISLPSCRRRCQIDGVLIVFAWISEENIEYLSGRSSPLRR